MREDPAPLDGLVVLDLAWVVAGPAIGRVLADFGAKVVRVESRLRYCSARVLGPFPNGRYDTDRSGVFDECNSGKFDIALNLGSTDARSIVLDLVSKADVLLESFAPGQMARWGLDYETLRKLKPNLVMLSTSLLGSGGPSSTFAGYGNAGAAFSGFTSLVGRAGQRPVGPYGPYTDFTGPRLGLVTLLASLDWRRRTGKGCWIDLSQAESGLQFLAPQIAAYSAEGVSHGATGNRRPNMSPHGAFKCAGGSAWMVIAVQTDEEWASLAELIGATASMPELKSLAGRKANEDMLEKIVEDWTAERDVEALENTLQQSGISAHRVSTSDDVIADPQLNYQEHFIRLKRTDGTESVLEASRLKLSETAARTVRAAPFIGQDSDDILINMLGYDQDRIDALHAAGALQ